MSDEIIETLHNDATKASERIPNPHLLAYDFFKHMTSLSVLTLGGILTLSGSIFADVGNDRAMLLAMVLVAIAGVCAFMGQSEMVDWAHRGRGRPGIMARWGRTLVAMFYGGGVGAFLTSGQGLFQ